MILKKPSLQTFATPAEKEVRKTIYTYELFFSERIYTPEIFFKVATCAVAKLFHGYCDMQRHVWIAGVSETFVLRYPLFGKLII
jgi:hypothetical protein